MVRETDTISRQAAINALEKKKDKKANGDIGGFYNKIIQNNIDTLMTLPTAQSEQMNDSVSRQTCIDVLTDENIIEHLDSVYDSELHRIKRAIQRIIAQLPSAQPERKMGRWIVHYECPKCGEITNDFTEYCPFCNADMREKKDANQRKEDENCN